MFQIGTSLPEARERRGLELADVERETRVRARYLRALEEERFEQLPPGGYRRTFLRGYANFLGLDADRFVDEYASRFERLEVAERVALQVPARGPRLPGRRASLGHSVCVAESRASGGDSRATTHVQRLKSRDGYFAPESVIRRLGNTPLVPFLGGGPAVLLQVAHPLVAAGVVDHSDVRRDLWRRLVHTLRALYLITYGTKEEADRAAELVQAVHTHVQGATRTQLGRFPPGTPYSASDPQLMLWVHATLVQASLAAYERFVHPLSRDDQERYYQEMALVARLFGTPASMIPRSLADFRDYFAAQISGETIAVTAPAKEVAAVILEARLPAPLRLFVPAHRLSTAGLLPPPLRDQYGLRWSTLHELALQLAARSLRITATPVLAAASRLPPTTRRLAA